MFSIDNNLITEKFCITLKSACERVVIENHLTIPYNMTEDGKNIEEFQQNPVNAINFFNKYHDLINQFLILANNFKLSDVTRNALNTSLTIFKKNLVDPRYCDAKPNILWNHAREHLEALRSLLNNQSIPEEKRLTALTNLGSSLIVCASGVVSHLSDIISALVEDRGSDIILNIKESLVRQLITEFLQDHNLCKSNDEIGMEVHYVNAFANLFSSCLGLNVQKHEHIVSIESPLIQHYASACWQTITERLPVSLVSYLANELCSAGQQVVRNGQIDAKSLKIFQDSPLAKLFEGSSIIHVLLVYNEESESYTSATDACVLQPLVAENLMKLGWLELQASREVLTQSDGETFCILADRWVYKKKSDDSENWKLPTKEELVTIFSIVSKEADPEKPQLSLLTRQLLGLLYEQVGPELLLTIGGQYLRKEGRERWAIRIYEFVDLKGYTEAAYRLGMAYLGGPEAIRDKEKALQYLQAAATQRYARAQYQLGELYLRGEGIPRDGKRAIELFQAAAKQGHIEAQYQLGMAYLEGEVTPEDKRIAAVYLKAASKQGHIKAQYQLGMAYLGGPEATRDKEKALQYLQAAATQRHAGALYQLGELYLRGEGLPRDVEQAIELFQAAAKQGHIEAQYQLGMAYLEGEVIPRDGERAIELFQAAARQGHIGAQYTLGLAYLEGEVIHENKRKAVVYLNAASKHGHIKAQYTLGLAYLEGEVIPRDEKRAIELFYSAARHGHIEAQYTLGMAYLEGKVINKNKRKAVIYLEAASKQGHIEAQYQLGMAYLYGKLSYKERYKAVAYLKAACSHNHAAAQYQFGMLCLHGDLVHKDKKLAINYFKKAIVAQDHLESKCQLSMIYLHDKEHNMRDKIFSDKYLQAAANQEYTIAKQQPKRMYSPSIGDHKSEEMGQQIMNNNAALVENMACFDGQRLEYEGEGTEVSGNCYSLIPILSYVDNRDGRRVRCNSSPARLSN